MSTTLNFRSKAANEASRPALDQKTLSRPTDQKSEPWWVIVRDEVGPSYSLQLVQAADYEEAQAKGVKQAQEDGGNPELTGEEDGFSAAYGFSRSELLELVKEMHVRCPEC